MDRLVPASTPDPPRPAERYGRPAGGGLLRRVVMVGLASCLACLLAWWLWVSVLHSNPAVRFEVTGFDLVTETSVTIEWVVERAPGSSVDCVLRARNDAGEEVGRLRVDVPTGSAAKVTMRHQLRTLDRPVTGEVLACLESPS